MRRGCEPDWIELFVGGKICAEVVFLRMGYFKSKREDRYIERRRRHANRAAPEREGPREVEMLRENDFQPLDEDRTDDEYGRRG